MYRKTQFHAIERGQGIAKDGPTDRIEYDGAMDKAPHDGQEDIIHLRIRTGQGKQYRVTDKHLFKDQMKD